MTNQLAIATNALSRSFGPILAVDNVELRVPQGSIFCFLGPNGAGKTTTTRIILGLIRPTRGEVFVLGRPLKHNRMEILRRVGSLVETPSLYSHLTGRENLEVTRRLLGLSKSQIDRALSIVKLTDAAQRRVGQYSLGMKQRMGLALALLIEPELLILDEPTNGLDPAGIHEMRDLIVKLPGEYGVTVFLSSHLLNEVEQLATHIGIINSGKLFFQGTLASLQSQREVCVRIGVNEWARADKILSEAGWTVRRKEEHILEVVTANQDAPGRLNRFLVEHGMNVFHVSLDRPSLESTFLEITAAPKTGSC